MVRKPIVFQVAGYQNSGKTTLVKKIIKHLTSSGFAVATIKHHGHGGKPDMIENKDSGQHISSGALASLVEGEGRILLQLEKNSWTLDEQIEILMPLKLDIIIIEGHKHKDYPKVVILRNIEDQHLLSKLKNIKAVLYWDPFKEISSIQSEYSAIPFFEIHDNNGDEWIVSYLQNEINGIR
ncbi:molybdopterin-guanine dinucleotide biosynthesis protein B [Bacillus sp. FJAT-29790]|uniref:molybdopterin-guanine dinucleotide biosynthesis protein B n=1 Tax=Bacillus sp. FJAT-29790 TaxID=1895002 RepID=UPI001C22699F|nr:molybdopterin-guanine dinucleotide biosynthesis protein B [Bacillus sp. FJAT-29790]MBU8877442.1 molybdopterin-guanine dinucleotide biosynthesis protein B [Bacillus sp. FJAT-29790]